MLYNHVFEIGDTPVPVAMAYRSGEKTAALRAVSAFRDEYETPVGMILAGDTIRGGQPVTPLEEGIVQVPYWLYLLIC